MAASPGKPNGAPGGLRWRGGASRSVLIAALALLTATYFLISPPSTGGYPGAIPWRDLSLLRPLTQLMSLGGSVPTERGVEIKDFAFHLATGLGLFLLFLRLTAARETDLNARRTKGAWFYAQTLLAGWVLLSAVSAYWSGDADISLNQAALYGLALGWAVALAWTLQSRDIPKLLGGLVVISTLGAGLCLWYYYERNPFHRPGFPIGNPASLASCLLPAILMALCLSIEAGVRGWRERRAPLLPLLGCFAALIPLIWCFTLTQSRAAMGGLAVGLGTILFLWAKRRLRWLIFAAVAAAAAAGLWFAYSGRFDLNSDRAATLRQRFYTWRYAAEIWQQRPISGGGAGVYARLSGQLSVNDRVVDPAAFLGDWIGHAHNELFEILAEIGLGGGLTFVGGYVATFAAALLLLQTHLSSRQRWLFIGLIASLAAQITDLMGGVGLRLPGVPAVFYTLLGTLWAACRCAAREAAADAGTGVGLEPSGRTPAEPEPGSTPPASPASDFNASDLQATLRSLTRRPVPLRKLGFAAAALAGAGGAFWLGARNWSGALDEHRAYRARAAGRQEDALEHARLAEARLLEPLRKIYADERGLRARFELAQAAYAREMEAHRQEKAPNSAPASAATGSESRERAINECETAHLWAEQLERRAPTLMRTRALAARCAEMLADLYVAAEQSRRALDWRQAAEQAWRQQRWATPYDVETLLALTRYPGSLADHVLLLRDALRAGFPEGPWFAALQRLAALPGFDDALAWQVQAAAPMDPQTDVNTLIVSMAPEAYRLNAARHALGGDLETAQRDAARAASLYWPMRSRFPTLFSVALTEQADYLLRAAPHRAAEAADLLRTALDALPKIQEQQHDALARPFRLQFARHLLAAGRETEAADVLRQTREADQENEAAAARALADAYVRLAEPFLRALRNSENTEPPAPLRGWLEAALRRQPNHLPAWGALAWLEARRGGAAAVKTLLQQAVGAGVRAEDARRVLQGLAQEFPALRDQLQD